TFRSLSLSRRKGSLAAGGGAGLGPTVAHPVTTEATTRVQRMRTGEAPRRVRVEGSRCSGALGIRPYARIEITFEVDDCRAAFFHDPARWRSPLLACSERHTVRPGVPQTADGPPFPLLAPSWRAPRGTRAPGRLGKHRVRGRGAVSTGRKISLLGVRRRAGRGQRPEGPRSDASGAPLERAASLPDGWIPGAGRVVPDRDREGGL